MVSPADAEAMWQPCLLKETRGAAVSARCQTTWCQYRYVARALLPSMLVSLQQTANAAANWNRIPDLRWEFRLHHTRKGFEPSATRCPPHSFDYFLNETASDRLRPCSVLHNCLHLMPLSCRTGIAAYVWSPIPLCDLWLFHDINYQSNRTIAFEVKGPLLVSYDL